MALVGPIDYRRQPVLGIRSAFTSYFISPTVLLSTTTSAVTANVVYFQPLFLPNAVIDRIGIEVTTGASGNCRIGLYNSADGMPSSLIVDGGAISTTSIAVVEATISATTLPATWVWMAAVFDATPTVRVGTAANPWILGSGSTSVPQRGISASFTYGSLPATATTPTAYAALPPMMFVRKT